MSITGLSVSPSLAHGGYVAPASPVPGASATAAVAAADQAKEKARTIEQTRMREEIRRKGLYGWAQEQKLEALKEKIRRQILAERDLTEAKLAALDPKGDSAVSKSIEEEIARRAQTALRDAMEDELTKSGKDKDKSDAPMIIDLSV